jgi:nucleoside-diphosphate-sugar epimerase
MTLETEFIVTGHKGEVGRQVCLWLMNHGYNYYQFDENYPKKSQHYTLLHIAAKHPTDSIDEIWRSNLEFMKEVAQSTQAFCKKAVLFSSTSAENISMELAVNNKSDQKLNEQIYGLSKCLGEVYFKEVFQCSLCLRLPAILELNSSKNLLSKLFDKINANKTVVLVNAQTPFNRFINVNDIMLFIQSQQSVITHACMNIAVKPEISLAKICEIIKSELQSTSKIIEDTQTKQPLDIVDTTIAEMQFGLITTSPQEAVLKWCKQRNKIG